jgi:hypothetical protein
MPLKDICAIIVGIGLGWGETPAGAGRGDGGSGLDPRDTCQRRYWDCHPYRSCSMCQPDSGRVQSGG